jgi:hypothetical protein
MKIGDVIAIRWQWDGYCHDHVVQLSLLGCINRD